MQPVGVAASTSDEGRKMQKGLRKPGFNSPYWNIIASPQPIQSIRDVQFTSSKVKPYST
jgi:hypothetical protein